MPVTTNDMDFVLEPRWVDKFLSRVDRSAGPDACWPWTLYTNKSGYGVVAKPQGNRSLLAHRAAFVVSGGKLTKNNPFVLHSCHNRNCCNPKHLRRGTQSDNMKDMYGADRGNRPVGDSHWTRTRPHLVARGDRSGSVRHPHLFPRGDAHWTRKNPGKVAELASRRRIISPEAGDRIKRDWVKKEFTRAQLSERHGVKVSTLDNFIKKYLK